MSDDNQQDPPVEDAAPAEEEELSWDLKKANAKTAYFVIKSAIDHREEPLERMRELSMFIEEVVKDPNCFGEDKEFRDFFYQDCTIGLLKRLNKERSADPEYLEVIAQIMKQYIRLFAVDIENDDLAESMKYVFDHNCILHSYHYEDEESELRLIEEKKKEQWRHDLQLEDRIDAIKGDEKCKCWGVAKIVAIDDEILELEFEKDSKVYDKITKRFSSDIAELGEFSEDNEWKGDLKIGEEIDAFDKAKVWYASTILDFRTHKEPDGREWQLAQIGFRLYRPDGGKTDEEGKKFDGWSSRFDEWLPIWSPKIAKLHAHSKPKGGKGTRFSEETMIDDSNDPQIKEGEEMVYAITRPRKCKSYLLIQCLNDFGRLGGYDKIIEKMTDKENPLPFELLAYYMDCIGKVYPMYHRDFIKTFALDVKDAVQNSILNAPEKSIRNVRREKIEGIVNRLNDLLKRVYNYEQRDQEIEHLNMDIVLMCLKSNFLERRIQGIKSLADTLKNLKYSKATRVSADYMMSWLEQHNILEVIFDPKNYHVQIVQRSKEILKFLIVEDKLTEDQLNLFWRATEFDDETRREIYKIIHDACVPMKGHHILQFLEKFESEKNAKIIPEAVECIFEMGRFSKGTTEHALKIAGILWRIAVDQKNPIDVSDLAISKICDLLRKWRYKHAKPYFYNCLENLKDHTAQIESIKIFRKIIKSVEYIVPKFAVPSAPVQGGSDDDSDEGELIVMPGRDPPQDVAKDVMKEEEKQEETKEEPEDDVDKDIISTNTAILHFIEEEKIIDFFLEDFLNYSKVSQTKYTGIKDKSKVQESIFDGRYDHKTNITERLEFLKFLAAHSNYTISKKEVDPIWNTLIDASAIKFDEEAVFKWLKESCETEVGSSLVWELQDIGDIFNERLGKGSNEMGSLTLDGFYCIQSYFLLANETAQNLKRTKTKVPKAGGLASFSNISGPTFSSQFSWSRNRRAEEMVEHSSFDLFVEPSQLDGISNIWKIVIDSKDPDVKTKSIKFLIQLYHQLTPSIEENKKVINTECIETALQYLSDIKNDESKTSEVKSDQIKSILKIFDEFLAQSERKGTTGLKQQRSLLKGELLDKITITNLVSYNKKIGKKIELSLFSNATVHDIKRIVGAVNKVPAEYVRLIRYTSTSEIKDIDNGKTLAELNFKSNEKLIANKQNMGNIPKAPLLKPDRKTLTPEAEGIFGEWFDTFSHDGLMTPDDCVEFIRACTDDAVKANDGRIKNLFQNHDYDRDGKVDKAGFVEFYRLASIRKEEVVRANILAHNYRNDLKKISDTCEENTDKTLLPRWILSQDKYFDQIFSLLDGKDDYSKDAWSLIQKLVTNPTIQDKILKLNVTVDADGKRDWNTLIDTTSIFKLLYMFQIIESLIEEGGEKGQEIVQVFKNARDTSKDKEIQGPLRGGMKKPQPEEEKEDEKERKAKEAAANKPQEFLVSELLESVEKKDEEGEKEKENKAETEELRKSWIFRFLESDGFQFSYDLFSKNQGDISKMDSFQKNFLGFILKILRIFITSAFMAVEPSVGDVVNLVRKQSSVGDKGLDKEDSWEKEDDDDEENIYSTPKNKNKSRTHVDVIGGMEINVTEEFLFQDAEYDIDSDKAPSVEEVKMAKKESTFSKKKKDLAGEAEKKIQQLADQLKENGIGETLIECIDFTQLQSIVLQSIASLIVKEEIDFDEKKIVENSLSLWIGCSLHNPEILDDFFNFKCTEFDNVSDLIVRGILYPSLFKVREEFLYTLFVLSTKIEGTKEDIFEYIFKTLLEKLPKDSHGEESCTAQYFELVSKLINEYFDRVANDRCDSSILDAKKFFTDVIDRIKSHQSREVRNSPVQDETLVGYLKLANMVLDKGGVGECVSIAVEKEFITELFQKCLFPSNMDSIEEDVTEGTDLAETLLVGNKCKTDESRKWAYRLLWTLCKGSPKLLNNLIEKQMFPLCDQIKLYPAWNYVPSGDSKSGKYVGIRNLGCICYMNSMLQQLYMVPDYRYLLLSIDDGSPPDWQEYKGRTIDDNVLHQLQRLFGHLELSDRVDYNPVEFCFSFKERDGSPTNTSVQHDTEEFFNITFERVEDLIKPTPMKYMPQSIFGGVNCSQMVCKECGFVRNKFEDFYNLSLAVKERKSVEESIRKNLEGEVINDYNCPGCKKKVDITKRTLFSKTPNVFIIQLQRIIFDYDKFENQKVNSHFEFPETLDLTPYSLNHIMKQEGKLKDTDLDENAEAEGDSDEEGEEDDTLTEEERKENQEEKEKYERNIRYNQTECYEYKLVGVIIHVGTADAGHYYSLINTDRFKKGKEHEEEWLDTSKDKWMEFNDSHVRDYNFEDLKGDSYGGSAGNDDVFGGFFKSNSYGKSAYLLVYEKRYKSPIKILVPEEQKTEEASAESPECDDSAKSRPSIHQPPEGAVIHTDPKTDEKYFLTNDVKMFVPNKIYKEIWEDNLDFSFEKLIYSKEFYEFVKELMIGTIELKEREDATPSDDRELVNKTIENMAKVGNKVVMEVLAKAFHNYKMGEVTDILIKLYESSDEAVLNTMSNFLAEEKSEELIYVFKVLLLCSDKLSRNQTQRLVSTIVNRCFEIERDILDEEETIQVMVEEEEKIDTSKDKERGDEQAPDEGEKEGEKEEEKPKEPKYVDVTRPKSMAVRFWDLTMMALRQYAPKSWSRFEHFLMLVRNIAIGGEVQTEFIMSKGGLIDFADFMLGQNSPRVQPGERRSKMGSVYGSPNFGPLLEAISHMIVRSYTPSFTEESKEVPSTAAQGVERYHELAEEDIKNFFLNDEFLKLAIMNSSKALGEAFAHLSYKNLEVSKTIGKIILKTINSSDYEKIKLCMTVTKPFLYIEDEFQVNRAEWILGYGCLITQNASEGSNHRFGTAVMQSIRDEAYVIVSSIDVKKQSHALLGLLWRYRGKMDFYVCNCLNILLEIIVENQFLSEYVFNLPPPTYEFARFTDWFRPYLDKELSKARKNMGYRHSTKKEESVVKCISYLEVFEEKLKRYERKLRGLPETEEETSTEAATEVTEETKEEKKSEPPSEPKAPVEKHVGFVEDIKEDKDDSEEDEKIEPPEETVIESYPKRYIVGCTKRVEDLLTEEKNGVKVTVQKCFVEYADSQPTLKSNKTLPNYAFSVSRAEADEYDRRGFHDEPEREIPTSANFARIHHDHHHFHDMGVHDDEAEWHADGYDPDTGGVDIDGDTGGPEFNDRDDGPSITVSKIGDDMGAVSEVNIQSRGRTNQPQEPETTNIGQENKQEAEDAEEDKNESDWNLPKKTGDVLIVVLVENTNTKGYNVSVQFFRDDEKAMSNVRSPINAVESYAKPRFYDIWMIAEKVDPDEEWGQFHIEWDCEEDIPVQRFANRNVHYGHGGGMGDELDVANVIYGLAGHGVHFYHMV